MIKTVKILIFTLLLCLVAEQATWAQIVKDNSEWTFEAKKKKDKEYELIVHLKLPKGWHIYALKPGGDGSLIAPAFTYKKDAKVTLTGSVSEKGKLISETLPGMDGVVNMYKGNVDYIQKATISGNTTLKVTCDYQICDDNMCLPPTTKVLEAKITDAGGADTSATRASEADTNKTAIANPPTATKDTAPKATISPANTPPEAKKDNSLLGLFLAGLGAGLLALLTPCIYSMVPITVSFFTKRSKINKIIN